MDLRWLVFSLAIALVDGYEYVSAANNKWTLCLVDSVHTAQRILSLCPKLATSPVECVIETDRFGCLRRVTNGDVDITVLEPEELVAIRNYKLYNVLVTNELRLFPDDDYRFELVAIAHKNVQRIWDVKGKRLCHPGLDTIDDWTTIFSTYFENLIIRKECNANMTLFEDRIHALSNFFETACIAGPWSADTVFDYQLKSKYMNLCAACEKPASCYNTDKYYGREGALLCLTDGMGDVALVRLGDARVHFKAQMIDTQDYKFLCPDGTTRLLDDKPCVWISKPWPVVVAKPTHAENIARMMNSMMNRTYNWESNVLQLMENYYITSTDVRDLQTPDDYLHRYPNFLSANVRMGCQPSRDVRWCLVSNLEKRKCSWLRDASIIYGVEPLISCLQDDSREACVEAVRKGKMDIFLARPEELLEDRMMGLKPIIHAMASSRQKLNRIAAVVKRNSRFRIMKDLKGARAAFTGYRSVGWNAFVTLMRNESDEDWDCSDAQAISKFFRDSCVFGWNNKDNHNNLPANLHSLCKEDAAHAGDDLSAFNYLASDIVDVAFVNLKIIENKTEAGDFYYEKIDSINRLPKYRVLGPTLAEAIKRVPYLLAWTPLGSIIAHENITDLRRQEIYTMLLEMDKIFGRKFNGQAPTFLLYGPYEDNHGVIFPDGTRYLELHGQQILKGRNYDQIVEEFVKQQSCSAADAWISRFPKSLLLCMIIVFILDRLLNC